MDYHAFTPSRPGGMVCIAERIVFLNPGGGMSKVCGYPDGHPIHEVAVTTPAEARTGVSDRLRNSALADVAELRRRLGGELDEALTVQRYNDDLIRLDRIEDALRGAR